MSPEKKAEPEKVDRRRGPRLSEADIRAKIEAEVRAEVEQSVRAEIHAKVQNEAAAKARAEAEANKRIAELNPAVDLDAEGAVTVNFVEDGCTLMGKVWVRGEEVTVKPDTPEWEMCMSGDEMILMWDEDAQVRRYGKRMWREGPWRGLGYDLEDPNLTDEERERLMTIQKERMERAASSSQP